MTDHAVQTHADAEDLAAFAEGKLRGDALDAVAAHLGECLDCRSVLGDTIAFLPQTPAAERSRSFRPATWLAAAAAVVAVAGGLLWNAQHRNPMDRLVAAAPADVRFLEPR